MAKHKRPRSALILVLRGGGVVVAVAVCLMAGVKLMSFAAGTPGPAAIGRSHGYIDPRAAERWQGPSPVASQPAASPSASTTPSGSPTPLATVEGQSVTAVGDSIMVAATPALEQALPGIYIDAMVGRGFSTGLDVIAQLQAEGQLRSIVVVGLGTNGPITADQISQLFAEIGPNRRLVLVNTFDDMSWEQEVNSMIEGAVSAHPANVVLADWYDTIKDQTNLLWPDGIHPQPSGTEVYAQMFSTAVGKVASLPG